MTKSIKNLLLDDIEEYNSENTLLNRDFITNKDSKSSARIINFPSNLIPIRMADNSDIKGIIELWANSASLRYYSDPVRWNWKGKASEVWSDYASDNLQDPKRFLIVCDLKDNGLSGFLTARLEELPNYYQAKYSLTIEELYLRPKDRKAELLRGMIELLLREARQRQESLSARGDISLKLEVPDSDKTFGSLLEEVGFKKSSVTYTALID